MAKAIFEPKDEGFDENPVSSTPVRDFSRVKKKSSRQFSVINPETNAEVRRVVPSDDVTNVYRELGDDQGYPRGYNPQQMQQVRDAEAQNRILISSDSKMKKGRKHSKHEIALLKENIARSKVDPTSLRTTDSEGVETPLDIRIGFKRAGQSESTQGFYSREGRFIGMGPNHVSNNVPIHEIGHDVQVTDPKILELLDRAKKSGEKHSSKPVQKETEYLLTHGIKEGDAERFGDENWVQDPRGGTEPVFSSYKKAVFASEHTKDRRTQLFGKGYRAAGGPEVTAEHPAIKDDIRQATYEARAGLPLSTHESGYGMRWNGRDTLNAAGVPIPESRIPPSRLSRFKDAVGKRFGRSDDA
jgi:hypothetical protein